MSATLRTEAVVRSGGSPPVTCGACDPRGGGEDVSKLRLKISMSLDGFIAGPRQSLDNPLGMGRNMFGGHPGPWEAKKAWNGWWGADPPFHHPVFVITHYRREPLELEGGTTFTFVTDGIEAALHGLELVRTVAAPRVTHLKFTKR